MFYADQEKICTKIQSIVFIAANFTPVIIWGVYLGEKVRWGAESVGVHVGGVFGGEGVR